MQNTIKNLEKNGFEVLYVKDSKEALHVAKAYIKDGLKIGLGGSTTVAETGLLEYLLNHKNISLINHNEAGIDMQENLKRRREGMLSDLYITSCNAVTQNGELVNADGSGNRVASQIFGPKKVLLLVGKNKIVEDINAGFERIKNVAAVKNIDRMNKKAISMGKEPRFNGNNIANKFTFINGDEKGRTTIILIGEELGY
ncbi:MAG TPA: lactate utilization protein [Sulfurospirillum arcachonense]|nr:lactate utilization protein [Sulfurospirillum arcachonense]